MVKKIFTSIGKVALWLIGVWIALVLLLEVCLSPAVMSKVIKKVTAEYIDGTLDFTKAHISLFKRFPSLYVDIEDFCLTYQETVLTSRKRPEHRDGCCIMDVVKAQIHLPPSRVSRPASGCSPFCEGRSTYHT